LIPLYILLGRLPLSLHSTPHNVSEIVSFFRRIKDLIKTKSLEDMYHETIHGNWHIINEWNRTWANFINCKIITKDINYNNTSLLQNYKFTVITNYYKYNKTYKTNPLCWQEFGTVTTNNIKQNPVYFIVELLAYRKPNRRNSQTWMVYKIIRTLRYEQFPCISCI